MPPEKILPNTNKELKQPRMVTLEKDAPQEEINRAYSSKNDEIYNTLYLNSDYKGAIEEYTKLLKEAKEMNVSPEVRANTHANDSFAKYFFENKLPPEEKREGTAYFSAMQGLELLKDPEGKDLEGLGNHSIRSRLYLAAALTKTYVLKEKGEETEGLFKSSLEEAEKSENNERIGASENGYGLYYISPQVNLPQKAIPHFEKSAKIQLEEKNKKQEKYSREAGHAYSNLIRLYNKIVSNNEGVPTETQTKYSQKAIEAGEEARNLYDPIKDIGHLISAIYHQSLAYINLGQFDKALKNYDSNKKIINDSTLFDEAKKSEIKKQDENIEKANKLKTEKNTGVIFPAPSTS